MKRRRFSNLGVCVAVDNLCGKKHDSKCVINAGGLRESAVRKGVLKKII